MQSVTDLEKEVGFLIKQIQNGSSSATAKFIELYSNYIYTFPKKYLQSNQYEAGEFYLYVIEHLYNGNRLSSFRGKAKFSTWFFSVLRNLSIDFLRSRKQEVFTETYGYIAESGSLQNSIEDFPDTIDQKINVDTKDWDKFIDNLDDLKIQERVIFKLSYVHFFDFKAQDIEWLAKHCQISTDQITLEIAKLKEVALKKINKLQEEEDKLTSTFQKVEDLRRYVYRLFQNNSEWPREEKEWSDSYYHPAIPAHIIELIHDMSKKINKHVHVVDQHKKHNISYRIPYKYVSQLIGIKESILSVQLLRIVNKIKI